MKIVDVKHEWKVGVAQYQFLNVVDKWQQWVSRGEHLPDDIEMHTIRFTADDHYVQLVCARCGAHAAVHNKLPITEPDDSVYWAKHPCQPTNAR